MGSAAFGVLVAVLSKGVLSMPARPPRAAPNELAMLAFCGFASRNRSKGARASAHWPACPRRCACR